MSTIPLLLPDGADGCAVPVAEGSLREMILDLDSKITAETLIKWNGQSLRLEQAPSLIPFRDMLDRARRSVTEDRLSAALRWCRKLVSYDPKQRRSETAWAYFLMGLIHHDAHPDTARQHYETVLQSRSELQPAAATNLAHLWTMYYAEAVEAMRQLQSALDQNPRFVPAIESQWRLADEMDRQSAPEVEDVGSWKHIRQDAGGRKRSLKRAEIARWLRPDQPLNYRHVRIIPSHPLDSSLASNIPVDRRGAKAAQIELHAARHAMSEGRYELALQLIRDTQRAYPRAAPSEARLLAAAAQTQLAEQSWQRRAEQISRWLRRFEDCLQSGEFQRAQKILAFLEIYLPEIQRDELQRDLDAAFGRRLLEEADQNGSPFDPSLTQVESTRSWLENKGHVDPEDPSLKAFLRDLCKPSSPSPQGLGAWEGEAAKLQTVKSPRTFTRSMDVRRPKNGCVIRADGPVIRGL